jgi:hypothetical protein
MGFGEYLRMLVSSPHLCPLRCWAAGRRPPRARQHQAVAPLRSNPSSCSISSPATRLSPPFAISRQARSSSSPRRYIASPGPRPGRFASSCAMHHCTFVLSCKRQRRSGRFTLQVQQPISAATSLSILRSPPAVGTPKMDAHRAVLRSSICFTTFRGRLTKFRQAWSPWPGSS